MAKGKRHTPEQIVSMLRQIEVAVANGKTTPIVCREAGITEQRTAARPELRFTQGFEKRCYMYRAKHARFPSDCRSSVYSELCDAQQRVRQLKPPGLGFANMECSAFSVPVLMREIGQKGAEDGQGKEAYS